MDVVRHSAAAVHAKIHDLGFERVYLHRTILLCAGMLDMEIGGTAVSPSKNSRIQNPHVQQSEGSPSSGGISTLQNKNLPDRAPESLDSKQAHIVIMFKTNML